MASMAKMRDLLAWSTEHQTSPDDPNYVPPRPLQELDPGLVDMILGKPDAVRMRDAMAVAVDESKSEEERVVALDDLELLIESLDNANDMEVLKLWEPILNLTTSPLPAISAQALWVVGTAVQNNPKSQTAFLKHEPFPTIINALSSDTSTNEVRAKALYVLSGALRHNREAVVKFTEAKGWKALKAALEDPHITVRRKTAFLLNALLLPDGTLPSSTPSSLQTSDLTRSAIDTHNILSSLTSSIVNPKPFGRNADQTQPDADYEEKAVRVVVTYLEGMKGSQTDVGEGLKKDLRAISGERKTERGKEWGLEEDDWDVLQRHAE
ncbi:hsp70 nucleotide exchange factor fes1 [Tulasnella sp. 424]|nr:hsp70 nucleotide exchange factor fes1 [Tulasnella sp. 424]KAG8960677.1 hsp70 nucleotide exchange factor fes1 [Tulasnella sp. 425]